MQQQLTLDEHPIETKPFRYITLDEQKEYVEFLEKLNLFPDRNKNNKRSILFPDRIEKIRWCASEYRTYDCTSDSSHTKQVKYLNCGERGYCPRCSMLYARKRAELMYQWIYQNLAKNLNFDLKMNQIVLTLPLGLQETLDKKTFSKMIRYFMTKFGIEAYCYSIQYRHSKDPLGPRFLHAHVLSLNIKEFESRIIRNDYYFDVKLMRKFWKHTIEKFTKSKIESEVNIYNEYASVRKEKPKITHLLSYLYRYSIQDLFKVQIRDHSINYLEKTQFDPELDQDLDPRIDLAVDHAVRQDQQTRPLANTILQIEVESIVKDPKCLVWCGLMTSTKHEYLAELLQNTINELVVWKNLDYFIQKMNERAKTCRDCPSLYSEIPCDKGKYQGDNEPIIVWT